MKKIVLILTLFLLLNQATFAQSSTQSENIALLTKQGFFDKAQQNNFLSPYEEVRKVIYQHLKYANSYNLDGLMSLYAPNYINSDGIKKDIYFDLIKKTWETYPNIKYKAEIKNIEINGNSAVVQVCENAIATTGTKSKIVNELGLLESSSNSVYYMQNMNNKWFITSDHILAEKTSLRYGSAKLIDIQLDAPSQIAADTPYTSTLKMDVPKDSMIIASIGKEDITYPQTISEEVFRKLPTGGVLERVLKSNNKNINEYSVASFGITKAKIANQTEIKIYITGLGFVMSRVNVIPKNDYVKVANNEKTQ